MIDNSDLPRQASKLHPTTEQLVAYGRGQCDDHQQQEISRHVLECGECCQRLCDVPDDPLLKRLGERADTREADTDALGESGETNVDRGRSGDGSQYDSIDQLLLDHPKYQLIRRLGEGGMGVVYLVRHRIMDRVIALKVISPRMIRHPDAKSRFQREVQIVAKLNHPGIVAAFDADQIGENLCLVSEYFESESLDQIIAKGPVKVTTACEMACQAAKGLAHAHDHGLIHRDVKPQNILVAPDGQVKVVDFGLASYAESENSDHQGFTSEGVIVGTPDYLSPEQVRESSVDHRADIYSLGCTLYHLLAGNPPFTDGSRVEKLAHHLQTTPKSLTSIRSDVSPALDACVAKMMAKDPGQRYQSAEEVAAALEPFARGDEPTLPPMIVTGDRRSVARRQRISTRPGRRLWIAAAALLALGLLGWASTKIRFGTTPSIDQLRQRSWTILAVIPPDPLPRDRALLYSAIDQLGLHCSVTSTSSTTTVEDVHNVIPLNQADPKNFDTVIFFGPSRNVDTDLYQPPARVEIQRILDSLAGSGQPYGSLGSGVWTLGNLGALRGKRVADCEHSTGYFKHQSGADWVSQETLVIDGKFVTGTNTEDATPFLQTLLAMVLTAS